MTTSHALEVAHGTPLLVLHDADTVGVALQDLPAGTTVTARGETIVLRDDLRSGHKVALREAPRGATVVKFGVDIGTATLDIAVGDHVHVHNLESERMRGDR